MKRQKIKSLKGIVRDTGRDEYIRGMREEWVPKGNPIKLLRLTWDQA